MQTQDLTPTDEINLFELIATLWKRKFLIIAITILGILIAAAYAFTAKEQWTSQAQLIKPRAEQIRDYISAKASFYRSSHFTSCTKPLDINEILTNAYSTFLITLNSTGNKIDFVRQSNYYKQTASKLDNEVAKERALMGIVDKAFLYDDKNKDQGVTPTIKFSATEPKIAQTTLGDYISYTNKRTLEKLVSDLNAQIIIRIHDLEQARDNIKANTEQKRVNDILELKRVLQTAKDAGINEYVGQNTIDNNIITNLTDRDTLFLLGTKYLQAQLLATEQAPIVYPTEYYQLQKNIDSLKAIKATIHNDVTYDYTRKPSMPLTKDKPKTALILLLGAILGCIVGSAYVLVRNNFRNFA